MKASSSVVNLVRRVCDSSLRLGMMSALSLSVPLLLQAQSTSSGPAQQGNEKNPPVQTLSQASPQTSPQAMHKTKVLRIESGGAGAKHIADTTLKLMSDDELILEVNDVLGADASELSSISQADEAAQGSKTNQATKRIPRSKRIIIRPHQLEPKESAELQSKVDSEEIDAELQQADVELIELASRQDEQSNERELRIESKGKDHPLCRMSFRCDSLQDGMKYSVHVEGLRDAVEELHESMKGMDKKLEKLNTVLKNLSIVMSAGDSSLRLNLQGKQSTNGEQADISLFIPKALESLEDLNLENLQLKTEIDDLDDDAQQIQTQVFVLRLHEGDVQHNSTLRTERDLQQDLRLEDLSLKPNPSNDGRVELGVRSPEHSPLDIMISSEDGRTLMTEHVEAFSGLYTKSLDLSSYGSGVYFVRVLQQGKSATMKVVIEK